MKTKVKIKVQTGRKGDAGTLVARVPVAVVRNAKPQGKPLFQTRAEIITHLERGSRPSNFKPRRAN